MYKSIYICLYIYVYIYINKIRDIDMDRYGYIDVYLAAPKEQALEFIL